MPQSFVRSKFHQRNAVDSVHSLNLSHNILVAVADISGFTAWSSIRDPHQVFTLLESIFQSFDSVAKKYRVFKVETIGDCYVGTLRGMMRRPIQSSYRKLTTVPYLHHVSGLRRARSKYATRCRDEPLCSNHNGEVPQSMPQSGTQAWARHRRYVDRPIMRRRKFVTYITFLAPFARPHLASRHA
jgi:Adenylate and Guanylate cyclase catalytic domain